MMDSLKVVFVDDDADFGNLICMGLTSLGYKVHFQTSLAGIKEVITEFSPSIIAIGCGSWGRKWHSKSKRTDRPVSIDSYPVCVFAYRH